MNHSPLKIILACLTGLTLICMIFGMGTFMALRSTGRALARALNSTDGKVAQISDSIATYDLPDGFGQAVATDLGGVAFIAYTGDDDHSHIYLFQLPPSVTVDPAELERQFGQSAGSQGDKFTQVRAVDQQPGQIGGQAVTLVVSEGVNGDNQPYRQVSALFAGRGGQAMVMVSGPVATWDQAMVDGFLASLQP